MKAIRRQENFEQRRTSMNERALKCGRVAECGDELSRFDCLCVGLSKPAVAFYARVRAID